VIVELSASKGLQSGTKPCVLCGGDEVTGFVEQTTGVRQSCSLTCCLFNIFIDVSEWVAQSV
jgi:hypothetical protein